MSTTKEHSDLIDASKTIGGICEMCQWASFEVADLIALTGKRVGDLTITELITIQREHAQLVRNRFAQPEKN